MIYFGQLNWKHVINRHQTCRPTGTLKAYYSLTLLDYWLINTLITCFGRLTFRPGHPSWHSWEHEGLPKIFLTHTALIIFMAKLNNRYFEHFSAAVFMPLEGTQTWRLHTKRYQFGGKFSPNISCVKNCTNLILFKVFYLLEIYHMSDSWVRLLNAFDFIFFITCLVKTTSINLGRSISELTIGTTRRKELSFLQGRVLSWASTISLALRWMRYGRFPW